MVSSDNTRLMEEILPEVRTSRMDVEPFESKKIIDSLMRETGINRDAAEKVTKTVLRRIIQSNVQWLSGPQIREMCSSVLAEIGLLEARRRYTRIGMPLMDYEELLTQGIKENANQYNNPESIHSWAADRISAEYTLLRLLKEEQSKAHLQGDIHVHMLRYFDLRPFCQEWDLRMILKHGLPPCGWAHSAVSNPANHAMVAILHAAKWLGIVQGEFSLPYWEKVLIEENGILYWRDIGEVVEENLTILKKIYTFAFNPKTLRVERYPITGVYKHKCQEPFLKIQMEYGREITVTEHHSLFTIDNSDIVPVKGRDLQVGDYIVVPRKISYENEIESLNLIDLVFRNSSDPTKWYVRNVKKLLSQKQIEKLRQLDKWATQHLHNDSIPIEIFIKLGVDPKYSKQLRLGMARSPYEIPAQIQITEDFLFLLGIYVAEGSGSYKKFNISLGSHEHDLIMETKKVFHSIFGYSLKDRYPKETAIQLSLDSELFRDLFENVFKIGHGAHNKRIPFFVFKLQENYVRSFIRGYFLGDGHCRSTELTKKRIRNSASAKTASDLLKEDINFLLLRLGIVSSISRDKDINIISIYGKIYLDNFLLCFKPGDLNWISEDTQYTLSPIPLLIPTNHSGLKQNVGSALELNHIERGSINQKQRIR
ncbi:MAG: hypothetical protein HWN66_10400, partial [Candidatus Helarchaeota archaeon]|nr:hypothetical protein [Candidatus Helarchaeota archaeon]